MMNDAIEHWTVDRDGHTYEVSIVPDYFTDINDFDCYGQFEWGRRDPYTGGSRRPDGFDGGALKFDTREGPIWWQPFDGYHQMNRDAQRDARRQMQDLLEFGFVGVVVELRGACPCCGNAEVLGMSSLFGIESPGIFDSTDECIHNDIVPELISEIEFEIAEKAGQRTGQEVSA